MNDLRPEIRQTGDGSPTLFSPAFQATYHSVHGAIRESQHVFIDAGLRYVSGREPFRAVKVLEMGLGTGLNAWLSALYALDHGVSVDYTAVERYPIPGSMASELDYSGLFRPEMNELFTAIHRAEWEVPVHLTGNFTLTKRSLDIEALCVQAAFDLIYYDAFGPETQPELWTATALGRMADALMPGGSLVTYCAKGEVRRIMQRQGLRVDRLPGPPGKREMLRAVKNQH